MSLVESQDVLQDTLYYQSELELLQPDVSSARIPP